MTKTKWLLVLIALVILAFAVNTFSFFGPSLIFDITHLGKPGLSAANYKT